MAQRSTDGPRVAPTAPPADNPAKAEVSKEHSIIGRTKRWLRIVLGFILITIGALFGIVPLIPGWPIGFLGLSILAAEFVWAQRLLRRLRKHGLRLREILSFRRRPTP